MIKNKEEATKVMEVVNNLRTIREQTESPIIAEGITTSIKSLLKAITEQAAKDEGKAA